jgi:hypothetical protein
MNRPLFAFLAAAAITFLFVASPSANAQGVPTSTCSGAAAVTSLTSSGDVAAATMHSSGAITSTAGTSQTAISLADCSRIIQTDSAGNYISLCGGLVSIPTDLNLTDGNLTLTGVNKFLDLYGTMAMRNSQAGVPITVNDVDGIRAVAQATVGKTCGTGADNTTVGPGTIIPVSPAGTKGRLCVCMLDNATYLWVNMRAPTEAGGNTTVCPATP